MNTWSSQNVAALSPGDWPQAFVAELRSQIQTEDQRLDQALESQYSRHLIISRGGQYARISWRDGETYEVSTAKMEAGKLQWRFTDTCRLAADGQQIISASSGRKRNHAEAVRDFLMLLEA